MYISTIGIRKICTKNIFVVDVVIKLVFIRERERQQRTRRNVAQQRLRWQQQCDSFKNDNSKRVQARRRNGQYRRHT